jgi:hypothetical protein
LLRIKAYEKILSVVKANTTELKDEVDLYTKDKSKKIVRARFSDLFEGFIYIKLL